MDFFGALDILAEKWEAIDKSKYDGVIVKKLEASNTLDEGRNTNQTHIAITGEQMDIFPFIFSEKYMGVEYEDREELLKKFFLLRVDASLFKSNVSAWASTDELAEMGLSNSSSVQTFFCVVRSRRKNQADQIQLSILQNDGVEFVAFRKSLHVGDYLVILKHKGKFSYDCIGIKKTNVDGLSSLNNKFFYTASTTPVNPVQSSDVVIVTDPIPENLSIDQLGDILLKMYSGEGDENKSNGIRMFGLKYGKVIKENHYSCAAITSAAGLQHSYYSEVNKGVNLYESIAKNEFGVRFFEEKDDAAKTPVRKSLPVLAPRLFKAFPLNCILYGAPGTGKTYSTALYALAIAEKMDLSVIQSEPRYEIMQRYNALIDTGRIVFTTFHQNYGYEDFIQGIRPDISDEKEMRFKNVDGVFKRIADKAINDPDNNYVIIIDEINRANISKVFGELITLIEEDKRWGEKNAISAMLPSGEAFAVPNNLYIVGTMNSADKSISLIDTALRRRFEFIEFVPQMDLITDPVLNDVLTKLNRGLLSELNSPDLLIGHSYFIERDSTALCDIMNRSIIPLLYEYFFDNQKKVEKQVKDAVDGQNVKIETSNLGRIKLVNKTDGDTE